MKHWPKIQVHGRWHAMTVAQCWPTHVLALVDDRSEAVMSPRREVVRHIEVFADITDAGSPYAPSRDQIARIIEFGRTLRPDDQLLVHCAAGIGRSPAGALAVWCALGREPVSALTSLMRIRPQADPNPLVVMYADDLLFPDTNRLRDAWRARFRPGAAVAEELWL